MNLPVLDGIFKCPYKNSVTSERDLFEEIDWLYAHMRCYLLLSTFVVNLHPRLKADLYRELPSIFL